jgi:hypothetical protein
MSTIELKQRITDKVNQINDPEKLKEIEEMIEWEIQLDEEKVYHLTEEQIATVNESEEQIKRGESISNEEANKEIEEWLKK